MNNYDLIIVGAGPAGLSGAIEAANLGAKVLLIDENTKPGGQLFKQIHKFFGSKEHKAGIRGYSIGVQLLEETEKLPIDVWLNTEVVGIDKKLNLWVVKDKKESLQVKGKTVILATGAIENALNFQGWTIPGVMGAGAAQTFINVNRVLPGKKVLMIGSGNVGVIVSYQLMQAGAEVVGIIEAAPKLGGYGVHTAKVRRAGVPFYTRHTIKRAIGKDHVEGAEIVELDDSWKPIPGTEKILELDTICLATGLTPLSELAWIAGCQYEYIQPLGGHIPLHSKYLETTVEGLYIDGDITGIEEASTAMEEGRLAGITACWKLGLIDEKIMNEKSEKIWGRLDSLRCGPFGLKRKNAKETMFSFWKEK